MRNWSHENFKVKSHSIDSKRLVYKLTDELGDIRGVLYHQEIQPITGNE